MALAEWERDLSKSAAAFVDHVWPAIGDALDGGQIVPVESVTAERFAKLLDTTSGVDVWQYIDKAGAMRGLASRVQWDNPKWSRKYRTFTIRKSRRSGARTELEKMLFAYRNRDDGYLWAHWIVQAYLTPTDELAAAAAVRSHDLCRYLEEGGKTGELRAYDGNTALYVDWRWLVEYGVELRRVDPENPHQSLFV